MPHDRERRGYEHEGKQRQELHARDAGVPESSQGHRDASQHDRRQRDSQPRGQIVPRQLARGNVAPCVERRIAPAERRGHEERLEWTHERLLLRPRPERPSRQEAPGDRGRRTGRPSRRSSRAIVLVPPPSPRPRRSRRIRAARGPWTGRSTQARWQSPASARVSMAGTGIAAAGSRCSRTRRASGPRTEGPWRCSSNRPRTSASGAGVQPQASPPSTRTDAMRSGRQRRRRPSRRRC